MRRWLIHNLAAWSEVRETILIRCCGNVDKRCINAAREPKGAGAFIGSPRFLLVRAGLKIAVWLQSAENSLTLVQAVDFVRFLHNYLPHQSEVVKQFPFLPVR